MHSLLFTPITKETSMLNNHGNKLPLFKLPDLLWPVPKSQFVLFINIPPTRPLSPECPRSYCRGVPGQCKITAPSSLITSKCLVRNFVAFNRFNGEVWFSMTHHSYVIESKANIEQFRTFFLCIISLYDLFRWNGNFLLDK